jgi:5'-nucleotidase
MLSAIRRRARDFNARDLFEGERPMYIRNRFLASAALSSLVALSGCGSGGFQSYESTNAALDSDDGQHGACSAEADTHQAEEQSDDDAAAMAAAASVPAAWGDGQKHDQVAHIRVLGLNDFHGQITQTKTFTDANKKKHPVGGIPVLTSWLKASQASAPAGADSVLITHSGDFVGASVPESGLLRDEPAILWFNQLANDWCKGTDSAQSEGLEHGGGRNMRCNLVSTLGNHEFDKGKTELLRKIYGGDAATGPYLVQPYPGAAYPYVCANAIDNATGQPLLPPYEIKTIDGERIAIIGAVTKLTPTVVIPTAVADITFLDEATAINSYIPEIQAQGVHAILVLIHEGGSQSFNASSLVPTGKVSGRIVDIVKNLDADVDVVLSAHSHQFTNALLPNAGGQPTLVTQAFSYSMAFAQIDLDIDNTTHDVVNKVGQIVIAYADSGPGLTPDPAAKALLNAALAAVGPTVNRVVGTAAVDLVRGGSFSGEWNIGDLITDAQKAAMPGVQIAITNPGGIRTDVPQGPITWGQLYAVQPFANFLVAMDLTGAQLWSALTQQWTGLNAAGNTKILQISGFAYEYHCTGNCTSTSASAPPTYAIVNVTDGGGAPILNDASHSYRVVVNNFLAAGGDNFPAFKGGANSVNGPVDLDALVNYVTAQGTVGAPIAGRIVRDPN